MTPEFVIASHELINMHVTTDHPGLLATLALVPSLPIRAHAAR